MIEQILQDLRYATRTLRRNRTFALIAIVCLAVGIGANTAVFSVVNGALLRELPFAESERIAALYSSSEARGLDEEALPFADLQDMWTTGVFEDIGALSSRSFTLSGAEYAERVQGAYVTPNLFGLLGMQPIRGRNFAAGEGAPAGYESVAIISDRLWQNRFGGAADIIGKTIRVNNRELTVVGVMPPGFRFPEREDLWVPYAPADPTSRNSRALLGIGKLREGTDIRGAQSRLSTLSTELAKLHPDSHRDWTLEVAPYRDFVVDKPAQRLMLLMVGSVLFVLLIAVANVANLLLARAADRGREIAVRAAIGASRRRVIQQLITESVLLALIAGGLGVLIALWWVDGTVRAIPEDLAYWIDFNVDATVLLYTLGISLISGLLFGLVPALQLARPNLQNGLRDSARTGDTRGHSRLRSALVVAEIALSLVLLVGAVLMVQSFLRLGAADPGFDQRNLQTLRMTMSDARFNAVPARAALVTRAADALTELPGVRGAVATTAIPADDGGSSHTIETDVTVQAEDLPYAVVIGSTRGLFETLDVPLRAGRDFTANEVLDTLAPVAIISEKLAARLWPGQDPIDRRIRISDGQWHRVIGIAPQLQYEEFGEETSQSQLQVHVPYSYLAFRQVAFIVRGSTAVPGEMVLRAELNRVDPLLAPFDIMSMEQRRRVTTWEQRLFGSTFGSFGAIAFVLALAGVYGVMAYTVARRRREIGVRIALGAAPADILRLVLGRAFITAFAGIAIGVTGAFALARLLGGLLWGVSTTDPTAFIAAPLLLAGSALLASYLPARRATRIEPVVALKDD